MPHKVVKYTLTESGTIPTFLKFGVPESTGGMYAVSWTTKSSPQDWVIIGISDDGADISEALEEITSKADLETYLSEQATKHGWTDLNDAGATVSFDAATHATGVWNDLNALNG